MPASTKAASITVKEVLAKLESLGNETRRKHNAKTGPDGVAGAPLTSQFGCKTSDIRALAKKIKSNHELAMQLWKTRNIDAQLLATLLMKPQELSAKDLDDMVREARYTWVADWFNAYVVAQHPEKDSLREKWMKPAERDGWAARAGWNLTASMINKSADSVDVESLLNRIEKELPKAAPESKWTMNNTLAAIGIKHAAHRKRVLAIAEKIGLYKDWPVSKGCTIPYVPVWIAAMAKTTSGK